MRKLGIISIIAAAALALASVACSGGDNGPATDDGGAAAGGGAGMILPSTLLTFEGNRYRLAHIIHAFEVDEGTFDEVGATSEADIEFSGELKVYTRAGDTEAVYTYSPKTADDAAFWLRWQDVRTETPSAAR